jgi:hypothetical protein
MWAIWPITAPARPCSCCMGFMLRARMAHPRPWLASATAPMPSPQLSWRWRHSTRARPLCQSAAPVCYQATRIVAPLGSGRVTGCMRRLTRQCGAGTGCVDGAETAPRERDRPRDPPGLGREGSKGCAGGRELPRPGPGADPPAGPGAGPPSKAHAVLERPRGPRLGGAAGSSCAGRVQKRPRIDGAKFQGWPNSRDGLVNEGR